mmetsp:Transcript_9826/g.27621  ORF Transcript_9826/g.27621 Transcript_9826/m.27621 type:complete len:263 (+) Transcript_9826:706-1494(+)
MDSRLSFSRRTSSSLLSSRRSCSCCCSTMTRRRRRSRSFRAMLPARLDSLIFRRNRPASCSSSCEFGMRACSATTSSRAFAAGVVLARSLSAWSSDWSLPVSLSDSLSPREICTSLARVTPMVTRPFSNASTPSRTSDDARARVRCSFSCCVCAIRCSKLISWLSRIALSCMFWSQCSALLLSHSSFAVLFWRRRSRRPKRWISRCSALRTFSDMSCSYAIAACFCFSCSNFLVTFSTRACFTSMAVARSRCSKKRRSCPSN